MHTTRRMLEYIFLFLALSCYCKGSILGKAMPFWLFRFIVSESLVTSG